MVLTLFLGSWSIVALKNILGMLIGIELWELSVDMFRMEFWWMVLNILGLIGSIREHGHLMWILTHLLDYTNYTPDYIPYLYYVDLLLIDITYWLNALTNPDCRLLLLITATFHLQAAASHSLTNTNS